jgi:hypothetical protein
LRTFVEQAYTTDIYVGATDILPSVPGAGGPQQQQGGAPPTMMTSNQPPNSNSNSGPAVTNLLLSAELVDQNQLDLDAESRLRRLLANVVTGKTHVVPDDEPSTKAWTKRSKRILLADILAIVLLVSTATIVGVVLAVQDGRTSGGGRGPTKTALVATPQPTVSMPPFCDDIDVHVHAIQQSTNDDNNSDNNNSKKQQQQQPSATATTEATTQRLKHNSDNKNFMSYNSDNDSYPADFASAGIFTSTKVSATTSARPKQTTTKTTINILPLDIMNSMNLRSLENRRLLEIE